MTAVDRVTAIVVTYNSAHCVEALARQLAHWPHVIVVDNGSGDGTVDRVRALLPHAQCLGNTDNRGFGAANNQGLAQVATPYALLLNPDCALRQGALERLLAAAEADAQIAIVAPQLVDGQGHPEINYRWPAFDWTSRGPGAEGPCCVGFACGACLLLNMAVMREVGFFDEDFFLYYEDDDLCTRAFARRHPIVVVPEAVAEHVSRGSVRGRSPWRSEYVRGYHHAQSKIRFAHKYQGAQAARRLHRHTLLNALLLLPLRLLLPAPRQVARLWGRVRGLLQWRFPA